MKYRNIFALILVCFILLAMSACGSSPSTENDADAALAEDSAGEDSVAAQQIDVLRLAGGSDWGAPNPFLHTTRGPGTTKMEHVFDSLLQAGTEGFTGWLAETYSISDDGLTYTFLLRNGALWHDGEPVTADDVAFTIDYYKQHPNSGAQLGTSENFLVKSYNVADPRTIEITVGTARVTNTENLGRFPIIPKHVWENVTDPVVYDGEDRFIGCGMYKFVSYDAATGSYAFEAFEDYYGPVAGAKAIHYVPISDAVLAFSNGDIAVTDVPADLYEQYDAAEDIEMLAKPDEMGYKLMYNMETVPEFRDAEVRRALYRALDRQAMVDAVFRGMGHTASAGYIPQTNSNYTDEVEKYDYDPDAARAVLEPLHLSLTLTGGTDTNDNSTQVLAEQIKMNLEAVGIEIKVEIFDTLVRDEMVAGGQYQLAINYHGGWNGEPVSMLPMFYGSDEPSKWHSVGYSNPVLMDKIQKLPMLLDEAELKEAYKDVQVLISQDLPNLPLITQVSYAMFRPVEYDCWKAPYNSTQFENARISYSLDENL
jgi:peptide/nickel transport system substrate-binding protein